MASISVFMRLLHFVGLGLALGAATTKLVLLLRSTRDHDFVATYIAVDKPITRLILIGTGLLALSGIAWLLVGYPLQGLLVLKIVLVVIAVAIGGSMGRFIEPRYGRLAPKPGEPATAEFLRVQRQYVLAESLATGLYYIIVIMWIMR